MMSIYYPADYLIQDAACHGVRVLPLDVRDSRARWTVDGTHLRVGLCTARERAAGVCTRIEAVMHEETPARTVVELYARVRLTESEASALATSGVLRGLEPDRRQAIWHAPLEARRRSRLTPWPRRGGWTGDRTDLSELRIMVCKPELKGRKCKNAL